MFPASGYTTASANPTATAASTALPPFLRISIPASLAHGPSLAIMACSANVAAFPVLCGHASGKTAGFVPAGYVATPEIAVDGPPTSVAPDGGLPARWHPPARVKRQAV